jgi:hypothetical protein
MSQSQYKGRPTCFVFIPSLLYLSYVWVTLELGLQQLLFVLEDIIFS